MKALILILAVLSSAPAFARDSAHFVCTGFMAATPSPDNYGFAIHFDDSRASDGESRDEVLSAIWGGELYQGALK